MSSTTQTESWRVTPAELAQYERRHGHPMTAATRRHLEFLYYQAMLESQIEEREKINKQNRAQNEKKEPKELVP